MATIETIRRLRFQQLSEGGDAARRDLLDTANAHKQLGDAANQAAVVVDLASRKQLSANAAFEKARIQVDALYAAQKRYESQVRALNRGLEQGEKTQEEYNSALELAKLKYDAAVSSATKYQATMRAQAQETIAARKAQEDLAAAFQKNINLRLGVSAGGAGSGGSGDRGADLQAAFASADRLRAKYDEVFAATQRYRATLDEVTAAQKAGILTEAVAEEAIRKATRAYNDQIQTLQNLDYERKRNIQNTVRGQTITPDRGADIAAYAAELDKLQAEFDPLFAATQKYNAYLDRLDHAHRVGAISAEVFDARLREAVTTHDALVDKINGVVVAQGRGARSANEMSAAWSRLGEQGRATLQNVDVSRRLGSLSYSTGGTVDDAGMAASQAGLDAIRAKYDDVFAAGQRYRASLAELRGDLATGAISEEAYSRVLEQRKAAFAEQINALGNYSRAQREAAAATEAAARAEQDAANKLRAVQMVQRQTTPARDRGADIEAYGRELDSLREKLVPLAAAEREYAESLELVGKARDVGALKSQDEYEGALARINSRFHDQVNEINKAERAQRDLAGGAGLSAYAYQNLSYQINDVITSLSAGISPMQTLAQQGGQIFQILQEGEGGVGGALKGIAQTSLNAIRGVGLLGGAFGTLAVASGAALVAGAQFNSAQKESERVLMGLGRASGATAGQIQAIAETASASGQVSTREARAMAQAFAATGEIGTEMFGSLIESGRGYAKIMGQDLATAGAGLAAAFADPEKGAVTLNRQLLILNATQVENIQTLARQGDKLGAQKALADALAQGVKNASELTSGWGRAWDFALNKASSYFDKIGKGVDRFLTGGDLETRIKDLQAVLSSMPESPGGLLGALGVGAQRGAIQSELDALLKRRQEITDASEAAGRANNGLEVQAIMDRYNPARAAIKKLEEDAANIESKLGDVTIDKRGEARRQMEGLRAQAQALRNDLAAGGQALADSLRNAQFENRMVGATGFGRSAAEINKQQDDKRLEVMRSAGTNTNTDQFNKQLEVIEQERKTLLDTLTKSTTQTTAAVGGAFSRMSTEVQQQLLAGSQRFPRVPVGIAAAIAQIESRGNLDIGYTTGKNPDGTPGTAYGLGQITAGTGRDLARGKIPGFDRMNRDTMGVGLAGVLDMKLDAAGGNLDQAIMNYYGSKDPAKNRAYLAQVKRLAGEMGDPSIGAQTNAQDAATRATRDQVEALKRVTEGYGLNTEKMNSVAAAQAEYNRLVDAGMAPNEELRKTLLGLASAAERANRDVSLVQFRRDNAFERDQLGRTDMEARAYSAARGRFGDVNDPRARAMIGESMETSRLQELKYTVGDTVQGFVTDLRRATSPLDALANAANRVADKLLGKFIDSFVSSAFGSTGPMGGGDTAGFISSLFGGGGGSPTGGVRLFANGGIMTPNGEVPLRAYARGGVARSPQAAIYGEGGIPEAYVPLPDGRSIPVTVQAPANNNAVQAPRTEVAIINNTGQPVERKTTQGPRGPREEIVIGKAVGNALSSGEVDDIMRRRYGLKAVG